MDDADIDLRGILGLLRRRLRMILTTIVVVLAIAAIVTFSLTPIFSASALVLVDPSSKNLLDPETQLTAGGDSARIDSEVEILRSDNILLKVIRAENLVSDPDMGVSLPILQRALAFLRLAEPSLPAGSDALNQVLTKLRNAVSIQRRGLTYLIAVQARSPDPEQATELANAIASSYIEDQLAAKVTNTLASRDILQARVIEARNAIVASEGALDSFIETNISRIAGDTGDPDLAQIQQQIQQLNDAGAESTRIANAVQAAAAQGDWQSVMASVASSALAELDRQRALLAGQLERSAENAPTVADVQRQLEDIEARLRETAASEVATLRGSVASTQEQISILKQDLREAILASALPVDTLTELYALQQNAELARSQYQVILARAKDLETQAALQVADSRIVSLAIAPETPSFPNPVLILTASAAIAAVLGLAMALLYENVIGGFTSDAQLASVLKTRVAGAVPRQKLRSGQGSLADLMVTAPLSVFAESIRRLRATLEQAIRLHQPALEDQSCNVIMVASTVPDEGKTALALALARSYALSGRRTLLIDCDLRKPSLHRHLGIESSTGLLEFLGASDAESLNTIISRDAMTPATIIVGARRSELPTDQLLTGPSFARLIRAARLTFDVVIIDTPPIGPVVDSLYVAPFANAIVFVTRWAHTSQADAKQALASLIASKNPATEIVSIINQQDQTRSSYQRKYGSYYSEVA